MDRDWIIKDLYSLLPSHIRIDVTRGLIHGPPPPSAVYEDHGIEPHHLAPPNKAATNIWQDPEDAAALVKNLTKLDKLGATARPIPLDSQGRGKMFGKPIYMVNSFGVKKDQKTRTVADLSQTPLRGTFDRYDPASRFCYNDGWTEKQSTMGFANIKDFAALQLSLGPVIEYGTTDYSGWFNLLFSHPSLARYHCMAVKAPRKEDSVITKDTPIVAVPIMSTLQGAKISAVHCAKQSNALMKSIAIKMQMETGEQLLSTPYKDVVKPEAYGLAKISLTFTEMRKLKRFQPRVRNQAHWIEGAYEHFCRWRTLRPGDSLPNFIVYQDDNLFALKGPAARKNAFRVLQYMHKQFRRGVIPVSTTCEIGNISQDKVFCGRRLLPGMKLTISDKRWSLYSDRVLALGYFTTGLPLHFLLSLAGNISYVMDMFPKIRALFAPFTWFLSQVNAICSDKKPMWKRWMKKYVQVPAILIAMVIEGWSMIYKQSANALDLVKLGFDANVRFSVDWCPDGGGSHNYTTGEYFRFLWPKGHELTENCSTKGEFFMLLVAARRWCKSGDDAEVDEDNEGCIAVVEKFKSKRSYGDIAIVFGRWSHKNNITIHPKYDSTDDITADPLSRSNDKDWYDDFQERCRRKGASPSTEVEADWESSWAEVLNVRSKYPIRHLISHDQLFLQTPYSLISALTLTL